MANTVIKYNDKSINSAFLDYYVIPEYQREYVWGDEQVEQLLSDLLNAYNADSNKAYFLGTIVTYDTGNGYFEVIDGQQRLTTFYMLLCAVKNIYKEKGVNPAAIEQLIYSAVLTKTGTQYKYHLQLQYEEASTYLEIIAGNEKAPQSLTQSGKRLFAAYDTITDFLTAQFLETNELMEFVFFLLNQSSFVRIETGDINDALKIFETINQRGKGLDSMDLLKNMVFRQVSRDDFGKLNEQWKHITGTLEKIDEKPLRFLRYFIMANYDTSSETDGILREDQIYSWLSKNNRQCEYEEKPFEFVKKMQTNVELYTQYRFPADNADGNQHLKNIPMLAGNSYRLHLMLMLAASKMDRAALTKFKCILESVVYYSVINKITTNQTERTFVSWCKDIRSVSSVDDLEAFVQKSAIPAVESWKKNNESMFMMLGLNSMQQYRIKFILGKITAYVDALQLSDTIGDMTPYLSSAIEIEHIMPQTCSSVEDYSLSEEEYKYYLNKLGNLTLLENGINKSIHNAPYEEKIKEYKKSKFYLTSSIPELVPMGRNTATNRTNALLNSWQTWNKDSIDERQRMLYKLSEMIWKL